MSVLQIRQNTDKRCRMFYFYNKLFMNTDTDVTFLILHAILHVYAIIWWILHVYMYGKQDQSTLLHAHHIK